MNGLINTKCSKCGHELSHNSFMFKGKRHCQCYNCGTYEEWGSLEEQKKYWKEYNQRVVKVFLQKQEDILANLQRDKPVACKHCGSFLVYQVYHRETDEMVTWCHCCGDNELTN